MVFLLAYLIVSISLAFALCYLIKCGIFRKIITKGMKEDEVDEFNEINDLLGGSNYPWYVLSVVASFLWPLSVIRKLLGREKYNFDEVIESLSYEEKEIIFTSKRIAWCVALSQLLAIGLTHAIL